MTSTASPLRTNLNPILGGCFAVGSGLTDEARRRADQNAFENLKAIVERMKGFNK